jgi:major intracellular serine protease
MGHKDFTGTSLNDTMGHGTHISGLIDQYAKHIFLSEETDIAALLSKEVEYCQVILKIYDIKPKNTNILKNELDALRYAISIKVDVINISGGGTDSSPEEIALTKKALDLGIKIVAAAGNNHSDITLPNNHYYPACNDPRILVVGNIDSDNKRVPSSNYGDTVTSWEIGINVLSLTDATHLAMMTGSSQACAIKSGKLVHEMLSKQQH